MSFPGHPPKEVASPKAKDKYRVFFESGNIDTVEAHYVVWGSSFTKFYEEVSETNHVLVSALNNTSVREITELTEPDNVVKLFKQATNWRKHGNHG